MVTLAAKERERRERERRPGKLAIGKGGQECALSLCATLTKHVMNLRREEGDLYKLKEG